MQDNTYNGWTNYETWRVNLEVFDGMTPREFPRVDDVYELSRCLKTYMDDLLYDETGGKGLAYDYAVSFLSEVDYYSIAERMASDYELFAEEEEEESA